MQIRKVCFEMKSAMRSQAMKTVVEIVLSIAIARGSVVNILHNTDYRTFVSPEAQALQAPCAPFPVDAGAPMA